MRLPASCLTWLCCVSVLAADPAPSERIHDLASEVFKTREAAEQSLRDWAVQEPKAAEELFGREMDAALDPELQMRCRNLLKQVVLMAYRKQGEGYIGIQMREEPLAAGNGAFGIRVLIVMPDAPAAKIGMQAGDLVLAFEGKGWDEPDAMLRFGEEIRKHRPGQKVKLKVRRGAEDKDVELELARRPDLLANNGLLLGGFGANDIDLAKLQAQSEEKYFQEWLTARKQGKKQPPADAGGE